MLIRLLICPLSPGALQSNAMTVSFEFLRGVLGVIGVACAFMAGRSLVAVRKGWQKLGTLYGWIIRAVVCLSAIIFRHPVDDSGPVIAES